MTDPNDVGQPIPDEVERITGVIMENLGSCDLESALTVICGIAGQLVAHMSEGRPGDVRAHSLSIAENIKRAGYTHLTYLHEKKQREKQN